ncbi:MAG: RagB/SusD family nutrient uptake outer membrane protein [Spirosomataceae bacterium]
MKHTFLKTLALGSLLTLGACQDEFFDRKPYTSLPPADALKTESDLSAAANGMYQGMRNSNLFLRGIPFMGDLLADNVYLSASNSGRYLAQFNYSVNAQNADISGLWTQAYAVILRANNIINSNITDTDGVKQLKGEALTVRALMYFELIKWFGKPYTLAADAPGVPLVLTFDPNLKPSRNKVSEVYDQMVKDLNQAFDLMTNTTKNSSFVTKYVAKALLAKVLLYKGDYAGAKAAAQDVVDKGGYTLATSTGFAAYWGNAALTSAKLETIFEVSADGVGNVGFDALSNMYDQKGYGDGLCTKELYDLYSATDVRRNLLVTGTRAGESVFIVNKYQQTSNSSEKDDGKVLRLADVILILAEASARTNDETNALKYLNQIVQRRDPSAAALTVKGTDLLEAIITERRKELAFEGDRYPDLTRLGRDIKRSTQYPAAARTITITDNKRIAPIPQVELDANTSMVQNTGY